MFTDSDDYVKKDLIEKCVGWAEKDQCDMVIFDFIRVEEGLKEITTLEIEESGIYMNIIEKGKGESVLPDGSYAILSRYFEIAMQERDEMFYLGDTLTGNMNLLNYPGYIVDSSWSLPMYMLHPEEYKVTINGTSYSAAFTSSYIMYPIYGTTSVPTGWLLPLHYIKPSRTASSDDVARVRLLIPHAEGTANAVKYVYPCYYEITYSLGK